MCRTNKTPGLIARGMSVLQSVAVFFLCFMVPSGCRSMIFLSTPSVGRATRPMMWATCGQRNFYPRPLWGGRLMAISITFYQFEFLSTPSVGRATQIDGHQLEITKFLSTPSVGRATQHSRPSLSRVRNFYPRPPWGGRQCFLSAYGLWAYFYPRPPWGGRPATAGTGDVLQDFYPRPPWGGRPQKCLKNSCTFVSNHTIGSLIYREILPELQRNRQNNLCFTPKIRCDSPG